MRSAESRVIPHPQLCILNLKMLASISQVQDRLLAEKYVADRSLATVIFLSLGLGKPLFLEGEAGVGKTEVAKVLARTLDTSLIRLQCYEGLDVYNAVYEWAYSRQLLHLKLQEASGASREEMEGDLYSEEFLLARPLLQAVRQENGKVPVLLIDEIDRADEEFESFLLEVLSDFQITIPEIGTFTAPQPPIVVVTSNRTRQVHDALKRRCIYHWIEYPDFETEYRIVKLKVPAISEQLSRQIVTAVQTLRVQDLFKPPGVAETLDWAQALYLMDKQQLDEETINDTLGVLLKFQDDIREVSNDIVRHLAQNTSE
jgi:MoxR-like ATPase